MTDACSATTPPGQDAGLEWCRLPAATFAREAAWSPDGRSVRAVRLTAFEMTRTPVTNEQFARFVAAGGYEQEAYWTVLGWRHRRALHWHGPHRRHDPEWDDPVAAVTGVSWWEAQAFATWVDGTLPTDAQWEYAATGGARNPAWPDGAAVDLRRAGRGAHPAGSALGGPWPDMATTVAEWCLDNAGAPPSTPERVDPAWITAETDPHVTRGSCGLHDRSRCLTGRDQHLPDRRDGLIGFRVVRPRTGRAAALL